MKAYLQMQLFRSKTRLILCLEPQLLVSYLFLSQMICGFGLPSALQVK